MSVEGLSKKHLMQLREAGTNFYPTNKDGRKEGIYKDKVVAIKREEQIFRTLQSTEEFEHAISQPNFCAVFTTNSLAFVIDDDTEENIKVARDHTICTYRKKIDRTSFHYFVIAKTTRILKSLQ